MPARITIVPAAHLLAACREEDVRRFLHLLAERVGRMEIASRDLQQTLLTLGRANEQDGSCPRCGRAFSPP